jgi:hypothetical protein
MALIALFAPMPRSTNRSTHSMVITGCQLQNVTADSAAATFICADDAGRQWSCCLVAILPAGGHFAPGALALGRLLVTSLALRVVWLLSGGGWPTRMEMSASRAACATALRSQ